MAVVRLPVPDVCQEACRCQECGAWLERTPDAAGVAGFWQCPWLHGGLIADWLLEDRIAACLERLAPGRRRPGPERVRLDLWRWSEHNRMASGRRGRIDDDVSAVQEIHQRALFPECG